MLPPCTSPSPRDVYLFINCSPMLACMVSSALVLLDGCGHHNVWHLFLFPSPPLCIRLFIFCEKGQAEALRELLASGAVSSINVVDSDGHSPLNLAVAAKSIEAIKVGAVCCVLCCASK